MTDAHPRMALGTMHFGTRLPATQSREILDAYLDLGGQWIDTANCYAFWGSETGFGGQSETVIGQWLADRGVRGQVPSCPAPTPAPATATESAHTNKNFRDDTNTRRP